MTVFEMGRGTKTIGVLGSMLLTIYVSAYVVLSVSGRYEPAAIGLNGVKCYSWAPRGFHTNLTWRRKSLIFFAPLYCADRWLWHTDDASESGRYPITYVAREDVWKYYEAEGLLDHTNGESESARTPAPHSAVSDP
jgi:hypothetical protein